MISEFAGATAYPKAARGLIPRAARTLPQRLIPASLSPRPSLPLALSPHEIQTPVHLLRCASRALYSRWYVLQILYATPPDRENVYEADRDAETETKMTTEPKQTTMFTIFNGKTYVVLQLSTLIAIVALFVSAARWKDRIEQTILESTRYRWTSHDQQMFVEIARRQNKELTLPDVGEVKRGGAALQ
jgi:hypothetical protein